MLLVTISCFSFGQDFDQLMAKKQIDCSDISQNSSLYFLKYVQENKLDSATYLLNYWKAKCGNREPLFRAQILLKLLKNEFHDSLINEGTLNNLFNYQYRMGMIKYDEYYSYDTYKSYYGFIPPGQEFDQFTKSLAMSLKTKYIPDQMEYLFAEFYGDNSDTLFSKLQNKAFKDSKLSKEHEKAVEKYFKMDELHMSWITGVWIPTGELKKLGVHPELGFQMGMKKRKMNYDLVLAFKFLNSPNEYYARRASQGGELELTSHFFGGHVGLDVGRDIYSNEGHEIQFTGGIAFDGFDALIEDLDLDLKSASISSYNFNFGLGYRYYISNSFYLGLRARYNVVNYSLNNVIDFTGNPITIQFIIGGVENVLRNDNLKNLKYKLRK